MPQQKGKTLTEVVSEIRGYKVNKADAKEFALNNFAEIYAWIKHDVLMKNRNNGQININT